MPFVWSIGTIIGPAIGGSFARPAISMPSVFSSTGIFGIFPYLLPNLICACLLLISIVFGYLLLQETHPDMQAWSTQEELDHTAAETPLMATSGATMDSGVDLRADTYGTFNTVQITEEKQWNINANGTSRPPSVQESKDLEQPKVFSRKVVMILIALSIFTYHSMTYDHLLPIFLQDDRIKPTSKSPFNIPGGLGMTTTTVGLIMSINGIIALFIQGVVFPIFTSWLGVWKVFVLVTVLHPIDYFIVPFLPFVAEKYLHPAVYACLTVRNFTSILAYPVLLIMLKEAVTSPTGLGKVNGAGASCGAAARTIAPILAGYLYTVGSHIDFTGLAWWGSSLVAIAGALQIPWMKRTRSKTAHIRPMASFIRPAMHNEDSPEEIVHIMITDNEQV